MFCLPLFPRLKLWKSIKNLNLLVVNGICTFSMLIYFKSIAGTEILYLTLESTAQSDFKQYSNILSDISKIDSYNLNSTDRHHQQGIRNQDIKWGSWCAADPWLTNLYKIPLYSHGDPGTVVTVGALCLQILCGQTCTILAMSKSSNRLLCLLMENWGNSGIITQLPTGLVMFTCIMTFLYGWLLKENCWSVVLSDCLATLWSLVIKE